MICSGVNGAGGGGGSSFAIASLSKAAIAPVKCSILVNYMNNTCVYVTVDLPITKATSGVTQFLLEATEGYTADDFNRVGTILPTTGIIMSSTKTVGAQTVCGLKSNTMYSIRAVPYLASSRLHKSNRATFRTLSDPFNNYWEPIVPRRLSQAGNINVDFSTLNLLLCSMFVLSAIITDSVSVYFIIDFSVYQYCLFIVLHRTGIGRGFSDSVINYPNQIGRAHV